MERWIGKIAIVTGASSGIGEAISKAFATAGCHVVGLARREDRLNKLTNELSSVKGSFDGIKCDIRNEEDIINAFKYAEDKFGSIDVLVNNSGICENKFLSDSTIENIRSVIDVNLIGAALCTREAVKIMRKHESEGHIININSILGLNANLANAPIGMYAASKFGLRAMSHNWRKEFTQKKDKIRITEVYPGLVKTEIVNSYDPTGKMYDVLPHLKAKDISDCVIFALSAPSHVQVEEITVTPLHSSLQK